MRTRRFVFVSLALALVAVGVHLTSLAQIGHSTRIRARTATVAEPERVVLRAQATGYSHRGAAFGWAGLAVALASVGFVVTSARKREPARRSITIVLLALYVMLLLVMV